MPEFSQHLKFVAPLGGAVAFAGMACFLYYKLFQKDEEIDLKLIEQSKLQEKQLLKLEIKIPTKAVGAVIGRQGANIKLIQEKTSTVINFKDDDDGKERICIIKGKREKIEQAKDLILKAVEEIPVINSTELHVPSQAIGRIIGRSGATINGIQITSGAKIKVFSDPSTSADSSFEGSHCESTCKIVIKGTVEQLTAAQISILEKVKEEEEMRRQIEHSASNISQRSKMRCQNGVVDHILETPPQVTQDVFLHPMSNKKLTEAFVSAVESATHFWVQVVGSKTIELDRLVAKMTDYYSDSERREFHALEKVRLGDIVAARFPSDDMWYRGRICEPSEGLDESKNSVYFVDFGDTDDVSNEYICELRTDFLTLSFQAIECYLAEIDPESANSEESLIAFESLAHACRWTPVMVQIWSYKQEGKDTIPCVKVMNTSEMEDMDVAEELVKRGLARWAGKRTTSSSPSFAPMSETLSDDRLN